MEVRSMPQASLEAAMKRDKGLDAVVEKMPSEGGASSPRRERLGCIEQAPRGLRALIRRESTADETMILAGVEGAWVE